MSASAKDIKSDATTIACAFIARLGLQDTLKSVITAPRGGQRTSSTVVKVELLAQGGYNLIWLVSITGAEDGLDNDGPRSRFIIREPTDDALLPNQIENEIAFLTYIADHHPSIPVPKVYAYNTGIDGKPAFIAMEYIPGEQLSTAWKSYSESEKSAVTHKIAETIVNMAEITFDSIGGMTLAHTLGPTVEGHKLFKGRDKFHSPSCYDIGPYSSTRSYVLACYAKEIYYYTHAPDSDIDMDLFDETPKDAFIKSLQSTHDEIASNPSCFLPEEPFVLNHGDFNGRNILEQGTEIRAIIDWEFAGSYPLSELLDGSVFNVVEVESEEDADENFKWDDRIVALVAEVARGRGWDERKVDLLVNHHNRELQAARMEMFPGGFDDEQEEDPEEEREDESP